MTAAIRTEALTKHFGHVRALDELTLEVRAGEVFGFIGANGAGKTTTIRLMLGLLRPTSGRVVVNGFDAQRDGLRARAGIGYLPAEMPSYPDISGRELIAFLGRLEPRRPDTAWVSALERRFALSPAVLSRRLVDLSHGTRQKVGLVQALMGQPPLVVLDEPTGGLDPLMIEAFCETVRELRSRGHTVFLSSHVLSEVERLCQRVALVADGRLVTVLELESIRRDAPRTVRVVFAGAPPASLDVPDVEVVERTDREWRLEVRGPLGPLLENLRRCEIRDLQVESFRLEDYVLALYDRKR